MAATRDQLQDDLSWDVDRLAVVNANASDDALAALDDIGDGRIAVERVQSFARADGAVTNVATDDLLRALQYAEGRLALVTWSSAGISSIGYRPKEQRFDVGTFSAVDKRMGNEYETYERESRREVKERLKWSKPTLVTRDEANTLPALDEAEVVA